MRNRDFVNCICHLFPLRTLSSYVNIKPNYKFLRVLFCQSTLQELYFPQKLLSLIFSELPECWVEVSYLHASLLLLKGLLSPSPGGGNDTGPCSYFLITVQVLPGCNLRGLILGGTQGSNQLTLGGYSAWDLDWVGGHGPEACTGASTPFSWHCCAGNRSHTWARGILSWASRFQSVLCFAQSRLSLA